MQSIPISYFGFSCFETCTTLYGWGRNDKGQLGMIPPAQQQNHVFVLKVLKHDSLSIKAACWGAESSHILDIDGSIHSNPNIPYNYPIYDLFLFPPYNMYLKMGSNLYHLRNISHSTISFSSPTCKSCITNLIRLPVPTLSSVKQNHLLHHQQILYRCYLP